MYELINRKCLESKIFKAEFGVIKHLTFRVHKEAEHAV